MPWAPCVTPTNDGVSRAMRRSACSVLSVPAVEYSVSAEKIRCDDAAQQAFRERHHLVGVDHHRNAAPQCFRAQVGDELGAAIFGQHRRAVLEQRVGMGSLTFHSSGSRYVTIVRSPVGSIMMLESGVTSPGICDDGANESMPSAPSWSKI